MLAATEIIAPSQVASGISARAPAILSAGPVALDVQTRCLVGPHGQTRLHRGSFAILYELLHHPGITLGHSQLGNALGLDSDLSPDQIIPSVRMHVLRARRAMEKVGLPSGLLQTIHGAGYCLDCEPRVIRVLTPEQAETVDRLLGAHLGQIATTEMFPTRTPEHAP